MTASAAETFGSNAIAKSLKEVTMVKPQITAIDNINKAISMVKKICPSTRRRIECTR